MHRGGASSLLSHCSIMDNSVGNETTEHNVRDQNTEHNQHEDLSTSQPIVWFPSVTDSKKPKEGMIFASVDAAFIFYNNYAKDGGFGVRKSSNRIDKITKEEVFKMFVCHKEGSTKCLDANEGPKRRRAILREQCRALLSVKKNEQGLWIVVKFVEGHSHVLLSPAKTQFLPSHREVSGPQRNLLKTLNAMNVSTSQVMSLIDMEAGGHEEVGLQLKDLYNARRDDREMRNGQDAQMLIDSFERQNQRNPAFIYHYETDANNYLSRVFWADATCRMNYGYFGDTVVFDTTYKTNKYNMIFAPFKGVNHHYQTVYFGFAFLHDETTESFCWLFKKFLESMPGDAPKSIITDQDPAMANAISQIFPNTFHRWCIWHITQKLPNKLGSKLSRGDFSVSFHDLINNCETPEEFEIKWHDLMQQYELDDDNWLKELYDKRYKWVNAYLKHIFFAGMTSSQRSESHHSALQKMISPHHSFMDFVAMLKLILSQQRTNELQADQESITYKPKVKTPSLLEVHMTDVYTTRIFYMFQEEFVESGFGYSCRMVSQDENKCYYNVQRLLVNNKGRTVVFDKKIQYLTCSCKKFEFQGIPCRHLLLVLRNVGISDLPSLYILKRWCKNAKEGIIIDNTGQEILVTKRDTPQATRSRELQYIMDKLIEKGCTSEQKFELLKKNFEKMLAEFETTSIPNEDNQEINEGENEEDNGICPVGSSSTVNQVIFVKEPSHYRPKGCGERFKSRMEKIMSKPRLCRACGKRGVQHDSRNCPDKTK